MFYSLLFSRVENQEYFLDFIIDNLNYEWIVSAEILAEYKELLSRRKFSLIDKVREEWLAILDIVPKLVNVNVEITKMQSFLLVLWRLRQIV